MTASYKPAPDPEDNELEALFTTFDKQLQKVQQKFSEIEKDIAELRKEKQSSGDPNSCNNQSEPIEQ